MFRNALFAAMVASVCMVATSSESDAQVRLRAGRSRAGVTYRSPGYRYGGYNRGWNGYNRGYYGGYYGGGYYGRGYNRGYYAPRGLSIGRRGIYYNGGRSGGFRLRF